MRRYVVTCDADPATAWSLYARPGRWHEWSPHLRGAWGLGEPEVREGATGAVRLLGVVPIPVRIERVESGARWTWRVGGAVLMDHLVAPREGARPGCEIALELEAPGPLEATLHATYGPVIRVLLRNLARVAERSAASAAT